VLMHRLVLVLEQVDALAQHVGSMRSLLMGYLMLAATVVM
jgi:hypothetical protein